MAIFRLQFRIAQWGCLLSFAAFCALTLFQVLNRYVLSLPAFWTEELAVLMFIWSVMLGIPVALWQQNEIAVDILDLADGPVSRFLKWGADIVSLVFLLLLAAASYLLIERAGSALSPSLGLARWWSYSAITAGALLGAVLVIARRFVPLAERLDTSILKTADY